MPNAYEVKIADAVAAEMNDPARDWAALFSTTYGTSAIRSWMPVYGTDSEETKTLLEKLKIAVVPLTIEDRELDRAEKEYDFDIWVNFQKIISPSTNTEADALTYLAEQMQDFFSDKHELATLPGWWIVGATRAKVCELDRLYVEQVWDTSLVLTVQGWK